MNKNCENKCSEKRHDCGCNKPHPENCEMVLKSFHDTVFEALKHFENSRDFEYEALNEAKDSLNYLKKSMCEDEKGEEDFREAINRLNNSHCKFSCNKDSRMCKEIEQKINCNFEMSEDLKYEALCLLKEAIEKFEESSRLQAKGLDYAKEYLKCVHHKNDRPNGCHC